MLIYALSPVFGWMAGLVAILAGLVGFIARPVVNQPHDVEREIRRLTLKVRHPWKARTSRWLGID